MKKERYRLTGSVQVSGLCPITRLSLCWVALGLLACGCTIKHDYGWREYAIAPDRVSAPSTLGRGSAVSIVNAQPNAESKMLGYLGPHQYYGSLNQLTDAVVTQLSQELRSRDVTVSENAPKTLKVAVLNTKYTLGSWMLRVDMDLHVEAGDGYTRTINVSNRSPGTVDGGLNGAVALGVIEILNDPKVIAYLRD